MAKGTDKQRKNERKVKMTVTKAGKKSQPKPPTMIVHAATHTHVTITALQDVLGQFAPKNMRMEAGYKNTINVYAEVHSSLRKAAMRKFRVAFGDKAKLYLS